MDNVGGPTPPTTAPPPTGSRRKLLKLPLPSCEQGHVSAGGQQRTGPRGWQVGWAGESFPADLDAGRHQARAMPVVDLPARPRLRRPGRAGPGPVRPGGGTGGGSARTTTSSAPMSKAHSKRWPVFIRTGHPGPVTPAGRSSSIWCFPRRRLQRRHQHLLDPVQGDRGGPAGGPCQPADVDGGVTAWLRRAGPVVV